METKQKMSEFRERLDMTLASQNLADEEHIKNLVKKQLQRSSQQDKTQEPTENIVEKRTKEALNFLDMLKSTSQNDSDVSKTHEKSHACWKLQADNEEFRVMYREGPQGTPFHMLLVEGFVDAPVDVCLCVSWQSSLYKKWTIATMDIKLEFVPPALINFVSRQLIGSGYKLYKKTVTSAARGDEDFSKALEEDPLYSQIREGLNPHNKLQKALICENFTFPIPEEDANRSPQANESVNDQVSLGIDLASEALQADSLVTNQTCCGEIEEELIEEDEQLERSGKGMDHSPTNHFAEPCHVNKEKKVFVSPEVENALGILNEAISMVRESRVFQQSSSTGPTNQESPNLKRVMGAGSCFSGDGALPVGEVCVVAPEVDNMNRSSDEAGDVSGILNTREAKPESPTKELIRNQIMPVSPEQNFPISSKSQKVMSTSQNGTTPKAPMLENKANGFKEVNVESNGILASSKGKREMLRRQKKKQWICCLHLGPS
ncbi:uncharacterized protein LOC122058043 isoform X2 [Macadamia integrifolia]|uniref:uncharacterized protein LOC122058043 isoform X2 n=1 Tax=Macadamia integrifolia TaxID=60698 RepID=UPI001C532E58|nr:uncharacterized protein LOC122058043 isoform X2 [Macadamia integrifolia]